eukprot:scaffold7375_cov268-Pinguiococcus_pyrenoidosus.AAC.62
MHRRQRAGRNRCAAVPPQGHRERMRRRRRLMRHHRGGRRVRNVVRGREPARRWPRRLRLSPRPRCLHVLIRCLAHAHQRAVEERQGAHQRGQEEGPEHQDQGEHAEHRIGPRVVLHLHDQPAGARKEGVEGHAEDKNAREHRRDDEEQEEAVIARPDAVAHPGAMVVKLLHAVVADAAVLRPMRLDDVTSRAVVHPLLHLHRHGLHNRAGRSPGQDPRIRERRTQQRDQLRGEQHEGQHDQHRVPQQRHDEAQEDAPRDQHEHQRDAELMRHGPQHDPPAQKERVPPFPLLEVLLGHVQRGHRWPVRLERAAGALHSGLAGSPVRSAASGSQHFAGELARLQRRGFGLRTTSSDFAAKDQQHAQEEAALHLGFRRLWSLGRKVLGLQTCGLNLEGLFGAAARFGRRLRPRCWPVLGHHGHRGRRPHGRGSFVHSRPTSAARRSRPRRRVQTGAQQFAREIAHRRGRTSSCKWDK